MTDSILTPAAVLVAWSMIMLGWLAIARFGAAAKLGNKDPVPPGLRGQDIDPQLGSAAWKSHNYTHLMEQPTVFYAAVFILHLAEAVTPMTIAFAWAYVILRIIHSLYQSLINKVPVRFGIFILSTVCMVVLAIQAVLATV